MNFIPAQESETFRKVFRVFVKWLFRFHFKKIFIHQEYSPSGKERTVYFLNHTSWWDGLIPFLLNEYCFKQKGRAMMEHKQMRKYPFFKWLGAFSTMPHDHRSHNVASLRYAIQSMRRKNASLYIYPQGEILPAGTEMNFKRGIGWLRKQLPDVDFVPIGISVHTIRHARPELHIWVGEAMNHTVEDDISVLAEAFEQKMEGTLKKLRETAGFNDNVYRPFF